jgi:DNA polymerase
MRYARHPQTEPLMWAWAFGDEPVALWQPGEAFPDRARRHIEQGGLVVAHSAQFELAIHNFICAKRYGWPRLAIEQTRCTLAASYSMALPGSLENAAHALGLKVTKDAEGRALMLKMCKPRGFHADGTPFYHDTPEMRARLGEYCKQDVAVEREIYKRVLPLSDKEQRLWALDQVINLRGVPFDMASVTAAIDVAEAEKERLNVEMARVTGGQVTACSNVGSLKEWAADYGVMPDSLAKAELKDLLEEECLPEPVKAALRLRQSAGRFTSVSKLSAIVRREVGGRVPYQFQYHAATTGRWAGRGVQLQNFPRDIPIAQDVEDILKLVREGRIRWLDLAYGEPSLMISKCLRGFIHAAPGKTLIGGDFSNVQGRGIAWLAGEEWKLDAFRAYDAGTGPDLYLVAAARIWGREFKKEDPERQHGKVAELACGFGGGKGALLKMAETYLVKIDEALAEDIKTRWRDAHPKIKQYWYDLQDAAINAVKTPGDIFPAGASGRQVHFRKRGSFLWCRLPSGRVLCYPYPDLRTDDFGMYLTFKGVPDPVAWGAYQNAKAEGREHHVIVEDPTNCREWCRMKTYGGRLSQNVDDAICRDLQAEAMMRIEAAGFPIVCHVHDDLMAEGHFNEDDKVKFQALMKVVPEWARDFPIAADCWMAPRYRKG